MTKKDELKNRVLNGGRGSGQSLILLVDVYENQVDELEKEKCKLLGIIQGKDKVIKDLEKQNKKLDEALRTSTKNNIERQKIIDKMKCCQNCKHSEEDNKSSTICDECFELYCWEMKE